MTPIEPFLNRIIHGDCIEVMHTMPANSVDLIVTDPPYVVNYRSRDGRTLANEDNTRWLEPAFAGMYRLLKPHSFCVTFYGWHKVDRFMHAWKHAGFAPVGHLVWVKPYHSKKGFTYAHHESAYLLAKGRPSRPQEPPRDVLDWVYTGNRLHPTQKPVTAILPLIEAYSKPGDIVLDPFAGSGTTAVAALQAGRSYIAIEKVQEYHRNACARVPSRERPSSQTGYSANSTIPGRPTHRVYLDGSPKDRSQGTSTPIGAAWPHRDGKGLNLTLDAIPAGKAGTLRLTLRQSHKQPT